MKKSFLVLAALLITAPAFADEAKVNVEQPLVLASADTSASVNLKIVEADDSVARLEKEVNAASDAFNASIEAKLAETIQKEVAVSVKF